MENVHSDREESRKSRPERQATYDRIWTLVLTGHDFTIGIKFEEKKRKWTFD